MIKDFKDSTWENFNEKVRGSDVYIWGAGYKGREIVKQAKNYCAPWKIVGFIDSNISKKNCEGYPVYQPDYVKKLKKTDVILISIDKPSLIAKVLDGYKFDNYFSYFWLNMELKDSLYQENIDDEKVKKVDSLLNDEYSKVLLRKICEKRRMDFLDYTDIQESGDEYFEHEFFKYTEKEVFVDGGGFDGDTVEEFICFTNGKYKKILTFEPDLRTGKILSEKIKKYKEKVEFYPYGLWDKKENVSFCNDNQVYSSHIVEEKTASSIECISLDEVVQNQKVTFIKMDIEGAEQRALEGAKKTIIKNKPKLAICIYHKPNDLLDIPLKIHEMVPEYKMYIRHFGARYYSTILFATI